MARHRLLPAGEAGGWECANESRSGGAGMTRPAQASGSERGRPGTPLAAKRAATRRDGPALAQGRGGRPFQTKARAPRGRAAQLPGTWGAKRSGSGFKACGADSEDWRARSDPSAEPCQSQASRKTDCGRRPWCRKHRCGFRWPRLSTGSAWSARQHGHARRASRNNAPCRANRRGGPRARGWQPCPMPPDRAGRDDSYRRVRAPRCRRAAAADLRRM